MIGFVYVSHGAYSGAPLPGWLLGAVLVLLLAGLVGAAGYTALKISPDNQQYREYFGLLGLKVGTWRQLPAVVGITLKLFPTRGAGTTGRAGNWGVWDASHVRH